MRPTFQSNRCLALGSIWRRSFHAWDFHFKDKTVVRPSYLYNGNSYTGEIFVLATFLFETGAQSCQAIIRHIGEYSQSERFSYMFPGSQSVRIILNYSPHYLKYPTSSGEGPFSEPSSRFPTSVAGTPVMIMPIFSAIGTSRHSHRWRAPRGRSTPGEGRKWIVWWLAGWMDWWMDRWLMDRLNGWCDQALDGLVDRNVDG